MDSPQLRIEQLAGLTRSQLEPALRHRSWCAEHDGVESNERLEFLGDSVLGLVVTEELYKKFPAESEGILARRRAGLVNAPTLAILAGQLGVGDLLMLGKGEESSGGRAKQSLLGDAFEAIVGLTYLVNGFESAASFVLEAYGSRITDQSTASLGDPKSRLQELCALAGLEEPAYETTARGPDHARRFTSWVTIGTAPLDQRIKDRSAERYGPGKGGSKKEAEQSSAVRALDSPQLRALEAALNPKADLDPKAADDEGPEITFPSGDGDQGQPPNRVADFSATIGPTAEPNSPNAPAAPGRTHRAPPGALRDAPLADALPAGTENDTHNSSAPSHDRT